jgi:hypothetical protein
MAFVIGLRQGMAQFCSSILSMKNFTHKLFGATVRTFTLAAMIIVFATSCARKIRFTNSVVEPAAEGYVKIKKDKNKNYALDIRVNNLASPKRLQPAKQTYVVWIETINGGKNIGQLSSASGLFTSSLKASLKTVTPFKPTRLYITAEDNGDIQYPGLQSVLMTEQFSVK